MGSDAIANLPLSAYAKDSSKKKKGNKLGHLKQNKLDVRREPWLSQAKCNGCKVETNGCCGAGSPASSIPNGERQKTKRNIPLGTRGEHHGILEAFDSEQVSWMSSSVDRRWGRNKVFSVSRNSYSGSCSSSSSEDDDWEAVADALTAHRNKPFASQDSCKSHNVTKNTSFSKSEAVAIANRCQGKTGKAWSPDDVFRPRSLPSLSKQQQIHPTQGSDRCFSRGPTNLSSQRPTNLSWQRVVVSQQPSSCPICCEDFDVTDSSFQPCPCGFQLCLFCHKRILEVDGRCPGCRKQYVSGNPGGDHFR